MPIGLLTVWGQGGSVSFTEPETYQMLNKYLLHA